MKVSLLNSTCGHCFAKNGMKPTLEDLKQSLRLFAEERDWQRFHSPKNLVMALTGEVGELVEHFQWLTEEQSRNFPEDVKKQMAEEMADVLLYLVRLADETNVDLIEAAAAKLRINEKKYPVELAKGNAKKYTEF